jgi:DsbC/DsbD-like thiol-disulfide interchange protein
MRWLSLVSLLGALWVLPPAALKAQQSDVPLQAVLSVEPATAAPGDVVELRLRLTVNDPWYVYADQPGMAGEAPLNLSLRLPEGVEAVGEWARPQAATVYTAGEHVFSRRFRVAALKSQDGGPLRKVQIGLTVTYQACTSEFCQPVDNLELTAALEIRK